MARFIEHRHEPLLGVPLRVILDRLVNEALVPPSLRGHGAAPAAATPPVNVYETDADLVVLMPLPGLSPNDIEIELVGTQLTVRTPARGGVIHQDEGTQERHTRHDLDEGVAVDYAGAEVAHHHHAPVAHPGGRGVLARRYHQYEFQIGPYARTVELPYAVQPDRAQTSYEHGLLAVRFPLPEGAVARRIPLKPR